MEEIFLIAAIVILSAFYGCFLIKMMLQKRKGIQTDQMGKGKKGMIKAVEITMKIANYLAPLAEILSILFLKQTPPAAMRITGIVTGILGDIVFIISVVTMKDSWRSGVPEYDKTELITNGIYRISRNPAFLGFDMVYIGLLCMYFNWYLFAVSAFAILTLHLQIVIVEEKYLITAFGTDYLEYKKHVNRYFGRR